MDGARVRTALGASRARVMAWRNGVRDRAPSFARPISQACTHGQLASPEYAEWCERLDLPPLCHRKLWEWCFILQALDRAGAFIPGNRGLGFGVGQEPIAAYAAARGCRVLATDVPFDDDAAAAWAATAQHAAHADDVAWGALVSRERFERLVDFRAVDMRSLPDDLPHVDFTWSSCALEHLGTLDAGLAFFERQLALLRPGGMAVHTTEYNCSSPDDTVESGHTVLYRRRDLESLVARLRRAGFDMEITFRLGATPQDEHVDHPPYSDTHIRTEIDGFVTTSFGLVARRRTRDAVRLRSR